MATIAELNVQISADVSKISTQLSEVKSKLNDVEKAAEKPKLGMLNFAAATTVVGQAFAQLKKIFNDFIVDAMKRDDELRAFNRVFKENADTVQIWSKNLGLATARTGGEVRKLATDFQIIIKSMGLTNDNATDMSKYFTQLSIDIAAYNNVSTETASSAIESALLGRTKALQKLGVAINDNALSETLLKKGYRGTFDSLDDVSKATVVYETIMRKAGEVNGTAAKDIDTVSSNWREFNISLGEVSKTIGNTLLPIFNELITTGFNRNIKAIREVNIEYRKHIELLQKDAQKDAYEIARAAELESGKTETDLKANLNAQKEYWEKRKSFEQSALNEFYKLNNDEMGAVKEKYKELYATATAYGFDTTILKKNELLEIENAEKASAQKRIAIAQTVFQAMSGLVNQFSAINSQINTNIAIEFDNRQHREMKQIQEKYDKEKAAIEGGADSARIKAEKLKALDEKRARDEKKMSEKLEKDKRKAAYEAAKWGKAIAITQSIINTAMAVTGALSMNPFGPWNIALASMVGTLGAIQTGLIAAQPLPALAKGGLFSGPAIIGEAGNELALPLESDQGRNAMKQMAAGILDVLSESVDTRATVDNTQPKGATIHNIIYLDGDVIADSMSKASDNGKLRINNRAII